MKKKATKQSSANQRNQATKIHWANSVMLAQDIIDGAYSAD